MAVAGGSGRVAKVLRHGSRTMRSAGGGLEEAGKSVEVW